MNESARKQRPEYCNTIQKIMDKHKESQEALAQALGVTRSRVENWLNYRSRLDILNLIKIAQHYDVSADYLLGLLPAPTPDPELKGVVKYTGLSEAAILSIVEQKDYYHSEDLSSLLENSYFLDFLVRLSNMAKIAYFVEQRLDLFDKVSNGEEITTEAEQFLYNMFIENTPSGDNPINTIGKDFVNWYRELRIELFELREVFSDLVESYRPTKELIARGKACYNKYLDIAEVL